MAAMLYQSFCRVKGVVNFTRYRHVVALFCQLALGPHMVRRVA